MVWSSRQVYLVHCWVPCGMMRDVLERGPFPVAVLLWPFTLHPACTRVWASQKQGFLNLGGSISMLYFQPLNLFFSYNHNVEGKMAGITVNWIQSKYKWRCEINQQLCGLTSASNDMYLQMSSRFSKDFVSSALIYWICMSCQNVIFIFIFSV